MTREEFLKRLKEDKEFDSPEKMLRYKREVLQYFITNYLNMQIITPTGAFNLNTLNIMEGGINEYGLVNYAFIAVKGQVLKGITTKMM